jgi:nucleoside-diphosphate-sugar epimerase
MKVVVTGSSGFIGQHLVSALVARGDEVLGIDKRDPSAPLRGYRFERCNILDAGRYVALVRDFGAEAMVHLAARADLDEKTDVRGYDDNTTGVENTVRAVRETPQMRRAIFTSTQLVCRVGYKPQSDEDTMPNTLYGESKVLGEKIVRREDGGGVAWCIIRPTTVWGPGMSAHYQRFFRMIRRGLYFHVGHRPRRKSFGYVGNVVHQCLRMLDVPAEQIHRRTFYVGDYEPVALQRWADELAAAFGARKIRTIPEGVARAAARVGDGINAAGLRRFPFNSFRLNNVLTEYVFDMSNTREVCGENPWTLEAGVAQTAAWFAELR